MFLLSPDYWEIKQTQKKGRGVFAKKDIPAGTIIGDYLGKIIKETEEEEYEDKFGFYVMYYTENETIWPEPQEHGIHLINHACTPNTYIYTYKTHTLYFALRKIFKGEELTVAYLLPPPDEHCNPCTDICHCESDVCTGTMHLTEKEYDAWDAFDTEQTKGDTTPIVPVGKMLEKRPSYPEFIEDFAVFPLFGSAHHPLLHLPDNEIPTTKELRKIIRQTGRRLYFDKLDVTVIGVCDNEIVYKNSPST